MVSFEGHVNLMERSAALVKAAPKPEQFESYSSWYSGTFEIACNHTSMTMCSVPPLFCISAVDTSIILYLV